MSNTSPRPRPPRPPGISGNVLVVSLVVAFVAVMGTVIALVLAVEDDARVTSLLGLVLPALASLGVLLGSLYKLTAVAETAESTRERVEVIASQTTDLTNGGLDAKVRAAVADVLADHLIDPGATAQLGVDRARRSRMEKSAADAHDAGVGHLDEESGAAL